MSDANALNGNKVAYAGGIGWEHSSDCATSTALAYEVQIDLRGVPESSVSVSACDGVLRISAFVQSHQEYHFAGMVIAGRNICAIERTVVLPSDADMDDTHYSFQRGTLHVTMARKIDLDGAAI